MSKKQIVERILLSNVKSFIKERCALLGYVPNDIPKGTFNDSQEYQIKIAGDFTFLRDTAVWKDLNENSKFKDLDLSDIELELILFRFVKEFCNGQTNDMKEISANIKNNKKELINIDSSISDLASKLLLI